MFLHETAYEVLKDLHDSGLFSIPEVLFSGRNLQEANRLLSVFRDRKPVAADEGFAAYIQAGGRGTPEAVRLFRIALQKERASAEAQWYLGLSLFDLGYYAEAIQTMEELESHVPEDPGERWLRDWARIWIGHGHDMLGEREAAIRSYRAVLQRETDPTEVTMTQYRIGPVNAEEWATRRMDSPYKHRS